MTAVAHSPGVLRYLEAKLGTALPTPAYQAASRVRISALTFHHQFSRFEAKVRYHSGGQPFISFREGLAAQWEEYKEAVRNEALRHLGVSKWKRADVGTGRIMRAVIKAIEILEPARNNLVDWQNRRGHKKRSHRPLLDATRDAASRRSFEQWFLDFFQERLAEGDAFERFRQLAGDRYDLVAYLFFLKDWNRFMPIAPTIFDRAFSLLGVELVTARQCSWENYARYSEALLAVQRSLRDVAGVSEARLIDAHSFCWMLVRLPLLESPPPVVIPLPKRLPRVCVAPRRGPRDPDITEFDTVDEEQYVQREAERRRLGRLAQDIALQSERRRLREAGHPHPDQAAQPVWDEPGRGYDILSCELDGTPRHIEVKVARRSGGNLSFFLSQNEWDRSRSLANYHFYLVFNVRSHGPTVRTVEASHVPSSCLTPMTYLASLRVEG
jgi:hypothetical protein